MGWETFADGLASAAITQALGWAGDFRDVLALVVGLGVTASAFMMVKRVFF